MLMRVYSFLFVSYRATQWLANPNITQNSTHNELKRVIEAFVEVHQISEVSPPFLISPSR